MPPCMKMTIHAVGRGLLPPLTNKYNKPILIGQKTDKCSRIQSNMNGGSKPPPYFLFYVSLYSCVFKEYNSSILLLPR